MTEEVRFKSIVGPELAGAIDLPDGEIRGWGIFVHGFTLGKNSPAASRVSKQLAREGIGMLRYDNLGIGDSDGNWGDGSFTIKVQDTVRAATLMAERGTPADLLVGHSWGGAAAIAAGAGPDVIAAGALVMGAVFLALGVSGLLDRVARIFPTPVIRGVQLAVGLTFLKIAWGLVADPPASFASQLQVGWTAAIAVALAAALLLWRQAEDQGGEARMLGALGMDSDAIIQAKIDGAVI